MRPFADVVDQTAGIGGAVGKRITAFGNFYRLYAEGFYMRGEEAVFGSRQAVERLAGRSATDAEPVGVVVGTERLVGKTRLIVADFIHFFHALIGNFICLDADRGFGLAEGYNR